MRRLVKCSWERLLAAAEVYGGSREGGEEVTELMKQPTTLARGGLEGCGEAQTATSVRALVLVWVFFRRTEDSRTLVELPCPGWPARHALSSCSRLARPAGGGSPQLARRCTTFGSWRVSKWFWGRALLGILLFLP